MIKFHLIRGHGADNESRPYLGNELHSELIQSLIHSESDLCDLRFHTCGALYPPEHGVRFEYMFVSEQIEIAGSPESFCIFVDITRA